MAKRTILLNDCLNKYGKCKLASINIRQIAEGFEYNELLKDRKKARPYFSREQFEKLRDRLIPFGKVF